MGTKGGYTPIPDDPSIYGGRALTMVQSILKQIMATNSVKEIVLLGVDFYGTGYLDENRKKNEKELKLFYDFNLVNEKNVRQTDGIPLLKYLIRLTQTKFFKQRFKLIIPREVECYIPDDILNNFHQIDSVNFL